jgi:hypothetical protein
METIPRKDIIEIITDIDSRKEGFSISQSMEEVMQDRFANPFYKFIDHTVFENSKKISKQQYGYYSNNHNYISYLNFILKNKEVFDFTWNMFEMGNKISLIERFMFVYKNYFSSVINSPLYVGSSSKDESASIALDAMVRNSQSEVGETNIQMKQFFEALEKRFPGKELVNSTFIAQDLDKIVVYVINRTFHKNVNIVELYDTAIKRLHTSKENQDVSGVQKASSDIEFLRNINAVIDRNHYIIDSEWKRLDKGEGYLERRKKYVDFIMRNGIPTPLIINDISSQGFDSLKITYLESVKSGAINNEDKDLMISDVVKVASSLKSLESITNDGRASLKFLLDKKSSIAIPLLSAAHRNNLCKDLLKQHFEKLK